MFNKIKYMPGDRGMFPMIVAVGFPMLKDAVKSSFWLVTGQLNLFQFNL